jgi:hypothetical protein
LMKWQAKDLVQRFRKQQDEWKGEIRK